MTSRAKALGNTTSAEADKRQLASFEKGTKEADEQSRLASPKLAKLFLSLPMALAYALQTRPDGHICESIATICTDPATRTRKTIERSSQMGTETLD